MNFLFTQELSLWSISVFRYSISLGRNIGEKWKRDNKNPLGFFTSQNLVFMNLVQCWVLFFEWWKSATKKISVFSKHKLCYSWNVACATFKNHTLYLKSCGLTIWSTYNTCASVFMNLFACVKRKFFVQIRPSSNTKNFRSIGTYFWHVFKDSICFIAWILSTGLIEYIAQYIY